MMKPPGSALIGISLLEFMFGIVKTKDNRPGWVFLGALALESICAVIQSVFLLGQVHSSPFSAVEFAAAYLTVMSDKALLCCEAIYLRSLYLQRNGRLQGVGKQVAASCVIFLELLAVLIFGFEAKSRGASEGPFTTSWESWLLLLQPITLWIAIVSLACALKKRLIVLLTLLALLLYVGLSNALVFYIYTICCVAKKGTPTAMATVARVIIITEGRKCIRERCSNIKLSITFQIAAQITPALTSAFGSLFLKAPTPKREDVEDGAADNISDTKE